MGSLSLQPSLVVLPVAVLLFATDRGWVSAIGAFVMTLLSADVVAPVPFVEKVVQWQPRHSRLLPECRRAHARAA